jgi:hypothetical protein
MYTKLIPTHPPKKFVHGNMQEIDFSGQVDLIFYLLLEIPFLDDVGGQDMGVVGVAGCAVVDVIKLFSLSLTLH